MIIKELPEVGMYITSRNLENQYKKAKNMLQLGHLKIVNFKLRQPKKYQVYQFRINKKYRGFGIFRDIKEEKVFIVTEISDHQDF